MDPTIAEEREALERELQRLEALLGLNASWQALCLLRVRSGDVVAALDPLLSAERARLETSLAGNRIFQQRTAIARALAAFDVPAGALASEPDEQQEVGRETVESLPVRGPEIVDPQPDPISQPVELPAAKAKTRAGEEAPMPASLLSRLRRVRQTTDFDGARYAAYRSEIGEASVEIVKRSGDKTSVSLARSR